LRLKIPMASAAAVLMMAGCMVGPDFKAPPAPRTQGYTAAPLPPETAGAPVAGGLSQRLIYGQDIPAQWWTLFHSEALDELIRQALANNPTTAAAQATLRQARENLQAQYGTTFFPKVDANLSAAREKFSGSAFGQPNAGSSIFDLYGASVSVSYQLDFSGGLRRDLEALEAQVDYQRFQLEGTYLTLISNVATTVIKEASVRAQLQATRAILADQEEQFRIVERQFRLGGVSRADVLAQQTQLAQTRAALPPLEKELAQTRHLLAVLTGRFPSEAAKLPAFDLGALKLPEELPVSLPSSLVRQRPDVRGAESLLHAASAQVGVATANLYPQITLTGQYRSQTNTFGNLFNSDTLIWNLGAGLLQPLFHGGELRAKRRAAVAAYDQALAQYRETVLLAFQNVADVLRALEADARLLEAQAQAAAAAHDTLELTKKQFQFGAVSYLSLLNAERQAQQTRISVVQAQAARYADTVALFQSLGGGWWNREGERDAPATATTD
jgi:NodT family efflux transporter outer membrane factor (OMF) lipoprotein